MRKYLLSAVGICSAVFLSSCLKQELEHENKFISGQSNIKAGTLYFPTELKLVDANGTERIKTIAYDSKNLPISVTTTIGGNQEAKIDFTYDANDRLSKAVTNTLGTISEENFTYTPDKVQVKDANSNLLTYLTVQNDKVVSSSTGYDGTATTYQYNPTNGNLEKEISELSSVDYTYDNLKAPFADLGLAGVNEFLLAGYFQFTGREAKSLRNNATTEAYQSGARVTRTITLNSTQYPSTIAIATNHNIGSGPSLMLLPNGNATMTITYTEVSGGGKDYFFKVNESGYYATAIVSPEDYAKWRTGDMYYDNNARKAFINKIYGEFKDDFDFIFLVNNDNDFAEGAKYTGSFIPVASDVRGIGITPYNETADYGSDGKLKGLIHMMLRNNIKQGPSLHELCHYWANFGLSTGNGVHWGFIGGSVPGQLGGFQEDQLQLIDPVTNRYKVNGDFSTTANWGNWYRYSDLELYAMGLISQNEVAPFSVFTNVTDYDWQNKEWNGIPEMYTVDKWIEKNGDRIPSFNNSQKEFRILTIVISISEPTASEDSELSNGIKYLSSTTNPDRPTGQAHMDFYRATKGQAKIIMDNLASSQKP